MIEKRIYPAGFKFVDEDCDTLAKYFYTEINETFKVALNGANIIKTYRNFNDLTISLLDYSCLKVYKNNEELFTNFSTPTSVEYTIAYITANSNNQQLSENVSGFVAEEIVRLIINQQFEPAPLFQVDAEKRINIEYQAMIDSASRIFRYATITCNIFKY